MEMSRPALPPEALNTPYLAEWIEVHRREFPSPFEYMQRLRHIFDGSGYDQWLGFMACLVEPVEGTAFVDPTALRGGNFYAGGLVGLRVVDHAVGKAVLSQLVIPECTKEVKGKLDMDRLALLRKSILAQSHRSYEKASAFHPMFEAWSSHMPPERYDEAYLRAGFGFVHGYAAHAMGHQLAIDQAVAAVELQGALEATTGYSWDAALSELLGVSDK